MTTNDLVSFGLTHGPDTPEGAYLSGDLVTDGQLQFHVFDYLGEAHQTQVTVTSGQLSNGSAPRKQPVTILVKHTELHENGSETVSTPGNAQDLLTSTAAGWPIEIDLPFYGLQGSSDEDLPLPRLVETSAEGGSVEVLDDGTGSLGGARVRFTPFDGFEGLAEIKYSIEYVTSIFKPAGSHYSEWEYETGNTNTATVHVQVGRSVAADLRVAGFNEETEELIPGVLLPINQDDDNNNLQEDRQELSGASQEDDLQAAFVDIEVLRDDLMEEDVIISFHLFDPIGHSASGLRLWTGPDKGEEIIPSLEGGTQTATHFRLPDAPQMIYVEAVGGQGNWTEGLQVQAKWRGQDLYQGIEASWLWELYPYDLDYYEYESTDAVHFSTTYNQAPSGADDSYELALDTSLVMHPLHNDSDLEGDAIKVIDYDGPQHGSVSVSQESMTYFPNEGYQGSDSFTYYIVDPHRPQTREFATAVTVSLTVRNHVSIADWQLARVLSQQTAYGHFTTTSTNVPGLISQDQEIQDSIIDTQTAEFLADNAWEIGEPAAAAELDSAIDAEVASVAATIDMAEQSLESGIDSNKSTFSAVVETQQDLGEAAYQQAENAWDQALQNAPQGGGAGGFDQAGDQAGLEALHQQLEAALRSLSQEVGDSSETYDQAAEGIVMAWREAAANALGTETENSVDAGDAFLGSVESALDSRDTGIRTAVESYLNDLNSRVASLHSMIESKNATYLQALNNLTGSLGSRLEDEVQQARDAILDAYKDYYQTKAEFTEGTASESDLRDATSSAVLAILEAKGSAEDERIAVIEEFVASEQSAMVARVTGVAEARHDALLGVADDAKSMKDGVVNLGEQYMLDSASAVHTHDKAIADSRLAAANAMTDAEWDARLAGFNLDLDTTKSLVNQSKASAAAQFSALDSWYSTHGGVQDLGDYTEIADAVFQRRLAELSADQAFINATTAAETTAIKDNHAAEHTFATAVIDEAKASKERVAGYLKDYQLTVNQLDRDWVTQAHSKDVEVIETIANRLMQSNIDAVDETNIDMPYMLAQVEPYLNGNLAWPTSPSAIHPLFEGIDLYVGTFNTNEAEQAFAPTEAPGEVLLEPEPEPDPESEPTIQSTGVLVSGEAAPAPEQHGHGETIESASGVYIGTVDVQLKKGGQVATLVKRGITYTGADPLNGTFDFFIPLETLLSYLAGTGGATDEWTAEDWDTYFLSHGESPGFEATNPDPPPPAYDSVFDVMPDWMVSFIGGSANDAGNTFINSVDSFAAGMSSTVTGGLSDGVREAIYGEWTADAQDSGFYTAGQFVGIAPSFAVGGAAGSLTHAGKLVQAARTIDGVSNAYGVYTAVQDFQQDGFSLNTLVALTPVATYEFGRYTQWVKCFEADTPVAVAWTQAEELVDRASDRLRLLPLRHSLITFGAGLYVVGLSLDASNRSQRTKPAPINPRKFMAERLLEF